jgi:hypothetical protein
LGCPFRVGLEEPFDEVLELLAPLGWVGIETAVEIRELTGQSAVPYPSNKPPSQYRASGVNGGSMAIVLTV